MDTLNLIKSIYEKPTVNIILNSEILNAKIMNKVQMTLLTNALKGPSQCNEARKKKFKGIDWKVKNKLSLSRWHAYLWRSLEHVTQKFQFGILAILSKRHLRNYWPHLFYLIAGNKISHEKDALPVPQREYSYHHVTVGNYNPRHHSLDIVPVNAGSD